MKHLPLATVLVVIVAAGVVGCATQKAASSRMTMSRAGGTEKPGGIQGLTAGWNAAIASLSPSSGAGKTAPPDEIDEKQDKAASKARVAMSMAMLSERRGQTEQARHFYEELARREPNNPTPYWRLGVMSGRAGKFQEAEKHLAKAASLLPNDPELLCDLGYVYYLDHRLDEAEKALQTALTASPGHARACNNLALVLGEQRRDEECFELFRKTNGPARAYANMGYLYAQRGEMDAARAAYRRALFLDSSLKPAVEAMAQLAEAERAERSGSVSPARFQTALPPDSPVQAMWDQPSSSSRIDAGPAARGGPQAAELRQAAESGASGNRPNVGAGGAERSTSGLAGATTGPPAARGQQDIGVAAPTAFPGGLTQSPTQINQLQHQRFLEAAGFGRQTVAPAPGQGNAIASEPAAGGPY